MTEKKEFHSVFNTLACIPQILVNEKAVIFLRNDCWVAGIVSDADGFMNITFDDCVYCNEIGKHYKMENFMVRGRQILYIQIPDNIKISEAIEDYMKQMHMPHKPIKKPKSSFKQRRAMRGTIKTVEELDKNV